MGILFKRKSNNTYTVPSQLQYGEPAIAPNGELFVGDYSGSAVSVMPTGAIIPFGATTLPRGWLFCYGQNISRATYAALFAVIGTRYGAGDGKNTFALPQMQGRFLSGDNANPGVSGGTNNATLSVAQLPTHTPGLNSTGSEAPGGVLRTFGRGTAFGEGSATKSFMGVVGQVQGYGYWSASFASIGSSQTHNNIPWSMTLAFIIKY